MRKSQNKENKKIRNATRTKSSSITFKSSLEKTVYNTILQQGFNVKYEPKKFLLWDGFIPVTPYYDKETDRQYEKRDPNKETSKQLILKNNAIIGIHYTPDFYFKYNDLDVWIEAKGIENDCFYIKKKMFLKHLDNLQVLTGQKSIYFEVYTKKQVLQALEIIKSYG